MNSPTGVLRPSIYLHFVLTVIVLHVLTYIVAGTLAYAFIYESAIAAGDFDPTMRSPDNPQEWAHVTTWLFPAEILRGLLMGAALCPFLRTLMGWRISSRFWTLLGLLIVFSVWSATMPAPGSIEGWVYLRPGVGPKLPNPLLGYLEVPAQLGIFSFLVSWRIGKLRQRA